MSGTDELFPGAAEHVAAVSETDWRLSADDPDAPRRRRIGLLAFLFGLVATVGNISGAMTALAAVVAIANQLGDPTIPMGDIDWVIPFEFAVLIGGVVLGLTALVLGVRAARLRRGRVLGIVGAILGGLALGADVVVAALITIASVAPA